MAVQSALINESDYDRLIAGLEGELDIDGDEVPQYQELPDDDTFEVEVDGEEICSFEKCQDGVICRIRSEHPRSEEAVTAFETSVTDGELVSG